MHVTMVTPNAAEEFDKQQSQHAMRMMTTALYSLGFQAWQKSSIKITSNDKEVIVMETGVETEIA